MADGDSYAAVVYADACTELAGRLVGLIESEVNGMDERLRPAFVAGALARVAATFDDGCYTADGVGGTVLEVLCAARDLPASDD